MTTGNHIPTKHAFLETLQGGFNLCECDIRDAETGADRELDYNPENRECDRICPYCGCCECPDHEECGIAHAESIADHEPSEEGLDAPCGCGECAKCDADRECAPPECEEPHFCAYPKCDCFDPRLYGIEKGAYVYDERPLKTCNYPDCKSDEAYPKCDCDVPF